MNLVQDVEAAASATAAATASKVTVTGAGVSGFGWLMNSEWLAVLGAVVAVLGLAVNVFFQRRADRLAAVQHRAELAALASQQQAHEAMRDYWASRKGRCDGEQ